MRGRGEERRQDAISTGREEWAALNRAAASCIERCIRVCKFKLQRTAEQVPRMVHINPLQFDRQALNLPHLPCAVSTARHILNIASQPPVPADMLQQLVGALASPKAAGDDSRCPALLMSSCRQVHESFSVQLLPDVVRLHQRESLEAMNGACDSMLEAGERISFCLVCAINGRGFQSKLRMCSISGELACITCPPGTVVTVNVVGTVLRLNGVPFYMCPCCTGLRVWLGDGSDLDCNECPCWQFGGARSAAIASYNARTAASLGTPFSSTYLCANALQSSSSSSSKHGQQKHQQHHHDQCMVCGSKNTCPRVRMLLPEVAGRCMHRINFCRRHAPPDHMMRTVTSFDELRQVITIMAANSSGGGGGGGGGAGGLRKAC